jgi:hypothetical protein
MELQDIEKYRERLENEYLELLSYRQGIIKQTEEDEQHLKDIQIQTEIIIKDLASEITVANRVLEGIREDRKNSVVVYDTREQEITASLINIEEKRKQLDNELAEFSRSRESYGIAVQTLEDEKIQLEQDRIQIDMEKKIVENIAKMESDKVKELNEIHNVLKLKKIKQDRILKDLKIQGLKLDQRGEAVKKTKDFLINKAEAQEKERLHIESRQRQIKSAIIKLKQLREAQTNGSTT